MKRLILLLATSGLLLAAPAAFAGSDCDVDGNGECNTADRDLVHALQGAAVGDPDYLAAADLDGDGVISLVDVVTISQILAGE